MSVLYRKYRPQKFSQVFGQENVKTALFKALESGKISHAYLFCGSRGTGKTTTARIIAKALNCQQNKGQGSFGEPCDQCESCRMIAEGRYLDLIEIDAASNRGIDEIRDLREKIKLAPTEGKYKVYIIDEVHMLTNEAFNALLKTLEEPPVHAVFILCTTDPQKLPLTIISRCQRFDFKRAAKGDLASYLKYLGEAEKLELEDEAISLIGQKAEGSFRDAAKILDQLSVLGPKIGLETVSEFFALTGSESCVYLTDYLILKDVKAGVLYINKIFESGQDLREFNKSFLEYLRRLLVIKAEVGEELVKPLMTEEHYEKIVSQAKSFTDRELIFLIGLFTQSEERLKSAIIPQLPLELAVVEACRGTSKNEVGAAPKKVVAEKALENPKPQPPQVAQVPPELLKTEESGKPTEPSENAQIEENNDLEEVAAETEISIDFIKEHWLSVLKSIKPHNHSLEALLKGCEPFSFDGKILVLKSAYRFHKERIEAQKNNELLERILSEIIGASIRVKCLLGEKKLSKKVDPMEVENVAPVNDEDLVKSASDIFNGSLL